MAMRGSTDLEYTWYGVLVTDCDALLVLEKCLRGELAHIPRRPHDSERARLIKSGSVFVYESNASGIKRWTDGINWSPSRILTNFLVYHELEKAPPPGEKKRAIKRKRSEVDFDEADLHATQRAIMEEDWTDDDRRLMGSPQDNYGWKVGGLVKKTYSFDFRGASHHIISYFNPEDVKSGELKRPIHCSQFQDTFIRPELIEQGARSRNPITEAQIEQQRWERPLYQADSPESLMRQYSLPTQPQFTAPPQIASYHAHATTMPPSHGLSHRSSIHFPLEDHLTGVTAAAYSQHIPQANPHARHMSLSSTAHASYHRQLLQESVARSVAPFDKAVEASYHQASPAMSHPRTHSPLTQSPVDIKYTPLPNDHSHDVTYTTLAQTHPAYAVTSPPLGIHSIDTSYSHAISRPSLYHGSHSATDIRPPSTHLSDGPPPAKKSRRESAYASLVPAEWARSDSVALPAHDVPSSQAEWARPESVPLSAHEISSTQAEFTINLAEAFTFAPPTQSFSAASLIPFTHAQDHPLPSFLEAEFAATQAPGLFVGTGYTSPLTAPS